MTNLPGDDPATAATIAAVERFNRALNSHNLDAVMGAMTDDCIFENTFPPPDGERLEGQAAVRAFWVAMLRSSPDSHFDTEEMFATGDRCVVRWTYTFTDAHGVPRHLRGVDVLRVRDGKLAEKLAYVKG